MNGQKPTDAPQVFDLWREAMTPAPTTREQPDSRNTKPETPRSLTDQDPSDTASEEVVQQDESLPHEARRALVYLLKHGIILFDQKRLLFEALCRHRDAIESQLTNLYLRLLLDDKAGVALLLQPETGEDDDGEDKADGNNVTLINRRTLTLYETLLLLVLRKHYQERETTGERKVVVDLAQIEARLTPFLPLTNNSRLDRSKLAGALNRLAERKIVASARGEEERLEITPAIRYLVSADFLQQLLEEYRVLAEATSNGGSTSDA